MKFDAKVVDNQTDFDKRVEQLRKSGRLGKDEIVDGFYDRSTNTIYINPQMDTATVRLHEATHVWFAMAYKANKETLPTRYNIADQFLDGKKNITRDDYTNQVLDRLQDYPEYFDVVMEDGVVVSATMKE